MYKYISGEKVTNDIISVLAEQDLSYRVFLTTVEHFSKFNYSSILIRDDYSFDKNIVQQFEDLVQCYVNIKDTNTRRLFREELDKYATILNEKINSLFEKWFSNIYTSYLPTPKFSFKYYVTKRQIDTFICRIWYEYPDTNSVEFGFSVSPEYKYKSTDIVNIILSNTEILEGGLTHYGRKHYRY